MTPRLALALLAAALAGLLAGAPAARRSRPAEAVPTKPFTTITGRVFLITDGQKRPLAGALVYLNATAALAPANLPPVRVKALGNRLAPERIVVVVGQKLVIESSPGPHYFVFSHPTEPQYGETLAWGNVQEKTFTQPFDRVHVDCAIEVKFRDVFAVVPNANFTESAADGRFRLPLALPPGRYEIRARVFGPGRRAVASVVATGGPEVAAALFVPAAIQ